MANSLYQAILDKIRRIPSIMPPIRSMIQPKPMTIPFAPGRIYRAIYRNYKHDPRPLIFVLSSDAFHTHAINIHYLGGSSGLLLNLIVNLKRSNQPMTGMIMYKYMKMRAPSIAKLGYRVYYTKYLAGKLVSDGVSNVPMPNKAMFMLEPFVRALNQQLAPRVINRPTMTQQQIDMLKNDMSLANIEADQTIIGRRGRP